MARIITVFVISAMTIYASNTDPDYSFFTY